MSEKKLEGILGMHTSPRNEREEDLLKRIRKELEWALNPELVSDVYDYLRESNLVLAGWTAIMVGVVYSFEEKELAEHSLQYFNEHGGNPWLRAVTTTESLEQYRTKKD